MNLNINGFYSLFAFSILSLLSRGFCSWIKQLSYISANQTMRSVEKHYDQVKRGMIPYEKELTWLMRVSSRKKLTLVFYVLYYALTSLGVIGLCFSFINLFTTALNWWLSKLAMCLLIISIVSAICNPLLSPLIIHIMKKNRC